MVTTRRKSTTLDSVQDEPETFSKEKELDAPRDVDEVQVVEEVKIRETLPVIFEYALPPSNFDLVPSDPETEPKVIPKPPVLELKAPPKRHPRNIPKFSNFK